MTAPDETARADMSEARRHLVEQVESEVRRFGDGAGNDRLDPAVREALLRVPREAFVPERMRHLAYANRPLPIGHGQTISQPLVVALMTHHLGLRPGARVLDVGTGSGYQTAVLAELADEVVTVEIVEPLALAAREALEKLGYGNVTFRIGDGVVVARDLGPFDGVLVAAAADRVPEALVEQLAPDGRLVVPVGVRPDAQDLMLITKGQDGSLRRRSLFPVSFVPLTGGRHP
ncbi:MAG TPA: protein-L-isoaspartate(D-aspartate) O-methyltransferase [Geminicoccaceae bacterium]